MAKASSIRFIVAIVMYALFTVPVRVHAQTAAQPPADAGAPAALFTDSQADRGEEVFAQVCSFCHQAPDFAGRTFHKAWNGQSVEKFFTFLKSRMPYDKPGKLTPQEYADVVAYVLKLNGYPAGTSELATDSAALTGYKLEFK